MLGFGKKTVEVTILNADTGDVVAVSQMPVASLPDTFEVDTDLSIGDEKWWVVTASPSGKAEFQRTGSLCVSVRRVHAVDTTDLLFSLPTIADWVPGVDVSTPSLPGVSALHEDDWMQVEFVPTVKSRLVEEEIAEIREVYQQRKGLGFCTCHVRRRLQETLVGCAISVDELAAVSGGTQRQLCYRGERHPIRSGWAFEWGEGWAVYGIAESGLVSCAGLHRTAASGLAPTVAASLVSFAGRHDLVLVDWCRASAFAPADPAFHAWLVDKL